MNFIECTVKVYDDGVKAWLLNGLRHREGGPAVELSNGSKFWYLNGEFHREDGPACEHADGDKYWHLNGKRMSEQEHKIEMARRNNPDPCNGKTVEIDGKQYTLNLVVEEVK